MSGLTSKSNRGKVSLLLLGRLCRLYQNYIAFLKCLTCVLFLTAGLLAHPVCCLHFCLLGLLLLALSGGFSIARDRVSIALFCRIFPTLEDPSGRRHFAVLGGELILCRGPGNPYSAPAAPRDPVPLCRSLLAPKEGKKPLHPFLLS